LPKKVLLEDLTRSSYKNLLEALQGNFHASTSITEGRSIKKNKNASTKNINASKKINASNKIKYK
jgi:hypothetical protein